LHSYCDCDVRSVFDLFYFYLWNKKCYWLPNRVRSKTYNIICNIICPKNHKYWHKILPTHTWYISTSSFLKQWIWCISLHYLDFLSSKYMKLLISHSAIRLLHFYTKFSITCWVCNVLVRSQNINKNRLKKVYIYIYIYILL
jgi:hypothetical protein